MSARILIVDDSLTVRMNLMEVFEAAGLAATACASIAEARAALAANAFPLVILDVLLPDGDGIDLLKEIREASSGRDTAVMLLSSESEVRDRIRGLTTGADDYVGKPYEPSYVVARARELLRRGDTVGGSSQQTVLVIDDSVTFREALKDALEAASYRVLIAGSGEEGLRLAADQRPTAIIVDGLLPGIDGASVIRRIRLDAALRHSPCLLLTGSEDQGAEIRAFDSGADGFVRKEENTDIILARLGAVLRSAGAQTDQRATASLHAPKKILIVDDSETYLQALADALRGEGFEVVLARSGEEALELLAVQPVDCILLDLLMPGIGGHEACRRVKAVPTMRDTPVIMLTALDDREAMIQGLCAGADDYIAKSSDFDVLRARMAAQMRRKQFGDENRLVREQLLRKEMEAIEAHAAREVAETRAALVEEQIIRTQMERAAALLEAAPDPVVIVDREGRIALVNARTEVAFGYPRAELLGQPVEILIPERLHSAHVAQRVPYQENPSPREIGAGRDLFARRKDGSEFAIDVSLSPLAMPEGPLVISTVRDVTKRKQAEEALRASEEQLNRAQRLSHMGNMHINLQTEETDWSNETYRIFGMTRDTFIPSMGSYLPMVHPEDRSSAHAAQELVRQGINPGPMEYRIIRPDGTVRQISRESELVRDAAGRPLSLISTIHDITERKEAERRIQGQLEHLNLLDHITRAIGERQDLRSIFQVVVRSLEDSLPIDFGCVCLYDPAANALQVTCVGAKSEALAHELTMEEQASIGVDDNGLGRCVQGQLVYEPDIGEVRFPFPERLARGGLRSLVMAPLRSESRVFGVLVTARRGVRGFSSVECEFLRQLSQHVALAAHQAQLHGALQQAYDDLRQTQQAMLQEERLRALGQMASGIAHDINNALSPVALYTQSMLETERNLSERARGYLETIQRAVEDVARTVARMREFYRQRETQLDLAPVQMNSMVQQVVDLTRARWNDMPQQRGIMIQALTELAPDLPKVMGVESEIREALTNLVFNAVDAMPEGGTLTLRTRLANADAQRASVVVEVADSGIGMDEVTRQRCLEPFFTTKGERGTGLGLAMVFGMLQRHGADIEIASAPGAGTTMRLVFAVPTALLAEPGRPTGAIEAPLRLRLLLIDDDPILLKSLRDTLETDGHVIVTANGGKEGIATFQAGLDRGETFAAVITDLGMPYLDGRRVATAVKEASPTTPVILLTGWGQQLAAEGDVPPHVDRVLTKPPRLRELREALAQLCRPAAA